MSEVAKAVRQRRRLEDDALALGERRRELQHGLEENRTAISALLETAVAHGITVEHFATLVGVTRASLYQWRKITEESR